MLECFSFDWAECGLASIQDLSEEIQRIVEASFVLR